MKKVKVMLVMTVALMALVLASCDDAEHGEDSNSTQSIETKSSSISTDTSQDSTSQDSTSQDSTSQDNTSQDDTSQDKDNNIAKDNVILSYRYLNFAWGIVDTVTFVTEDGSVYNWEYTDDQDGAKDIKLDEAYKYIIDNFEPVYTMTEAEVKEILEASKSLYDSPELETEHRAMDAGSTIISIFNSENKKVNLLIDGDTYGKRTDENSEKLIKIANDMRTNASVNGNKTVD